MIQFKSFFVFIVIHTFVCFLLVILSGIVPVQLWPCIPIFGSDIYQAGGLYRRILTKVVSTE